MALKLITAPAAEPVSLSEAKAYLGIDDSDDDTLLSSLIAGVRSIGERYTRRAWVTQTWQLWLDRFPVQERPGAPGEGYFELPVNYFDDPAPVLEVPLPPLQSVVHIKTYSPADAASTFDAANYLVDSNSEPGRVALNQGATWPTDLRKVNAVEVQFTAGYGAAADVPDALKTGVLQWLKLLIANKSKLLESDEQSGAQVQLNPASVPPHVRALWDPYRMVRL